MQGIPSIQLNKSPVYSDFVAKNLAIQGEAQRQGLQRNTAVINQQKIIAEQKSTQRKNMIESNDYALNLLSRVNSQEDLDLAKRHFSVRYPEESPKVDQILPSYNPRSVEFIKDSLLTETQRMKQEEIKAYSPGSTLFQGGKPIGTVPTKAPEPKFEVFEGPKGEQVYVEKGKPIPEGYSKVKSGGTSVTVQTGDLGKSTKTKLEKDIIQGTKNIESFNETEKLFKPDYLTIAGKGEKIAASVMDKIGISTKDQKQFIRDRAAWFRQAKSDFISYRKWATGVAGGEKELKEIATSFPDPVKNSPTEYQANLDSIEETTKRVLELNKDFLESGISISEVKGPIPAPTPGGVITIRFDREGNRVQ